VYDFENEYKQKVVDYMVEEYKAGRTPNPDIMCNQEVKFKLFLETALEDGAEMIATGHYARVRNRFSVTQFSETASRPFVLDPPSSPHRAADVSENLSPSAQLLMAKDQNKDQTYFLYRVTGEALERTLFPLGEYTKPEVREMAKQRGLFTASKKDSQGICFVGQIGVKDFLLQYISAVPGNVIDKQTGQKVGRHEGAIFYTLGQRHGLGLGGGLPYYVVGKDMEKNEVYVTRDLNDDTLWKKKIELGSLHWINNAPEGEVQVRVRHRAPLIPAMYRNEDSSATLELGEPQRAVTSGQSVVIYDGDTCLGGGIVI
jgi:tRNA-specific 2-thiouridylase